MLRSLYYNFLFQLSENKIRKRLQLIYQLASMKASTTAANSNNCL
ncbi:phosphomannomutase [Tolypothrix sp. PCC 7601]|nr:phosphomannomutase [Tolypothrix sp. PCC 7601]